MDREASAPGGINSKDLLWFRCSPRAGPSSSTMCREAARSSGEPTKMPSSRYQALRESPGTLLRATTYCVKRTTYYYVLRNTTYCVLPTTTYYVLRTTT